MARLSLLLLLVFAMASQSRGQSEPSTYFNIYVPPNNEALKRNVALIVTAIADSTNFDIVDDDADGDSDDSISGMLMAGQSRIVYIAEGGINDDARYASGGTLKRDGDYFIIRSDKLVMASMSTDSDWQHDFAPSVNKKSVGQKFVLYSTKGSSNGRDINVFAYEQNTTVTISRISLSPTLNSGHTHVDVNQRTVVAQRTLNPGQDLIHHFPEGRKLLASGHTYIVESNKDVSVQYGALSQNSRDGGAYVPSANGTASGDLFYFAVPYQAGGEQEIRIISWDNDNQVILERYHNGTWIMMTEWRLNAMSPADWVGKQNGNVSYPTVFRVRGTSGKRVSVFEANWMETGSNSTSDMATMVASASGTSAGTNFLAYMLPPSSQQNVVNPVTGLNFNGSITHFYLFAGDKATTVTIKDAKTGGRVLNRTYHIAANRYADASFTLNEWKSIYNRTGTASGPERPYVIIEATENIAVLSTNFNDNWMTHYGSSLGQGFTQETSTSTTEASPGETVTVTTKIVNNGSSPIENASIEVNVGSGLIPVESTLKNNTTSQKWVGDILVTDTGSSITFNDVKDIKQSDDLEIDTKVILHPTLNDGTPINDGTVVSIETVVSGTIDGSYQQSVSSQGIQNNSADNSNLLFAVCGTGPIVTHSNDSWNGAWVDIDRNGFDDLFVTTKNPKQPNELYLSKGDGNYTRVTDSALLTQLGTTVASVWADINNDGWMDVLVVNATEKRSLLYLNKGNGAFDPQLNSGLELHPQYYHGAAFADFDNDGFVDLVITNFFPTRFHQLYKNNGDNTFALITNTPVSTVSERAMAPILADYDHDGFVDIFIPNGNDRPNSLFRNLGGFQFEKITTGEIVNDAFNSVGAAWGDYNNDGYPDLYVVNASGQNNNLYRNNGDGTFTSVRDILIVNERGHNHSAAWLDLDNNGHLDLFVTNDQGSNALYLNDGKGNFERKSGELIGGNTGRTYGTALSDVNRDGRMDIMVFNHSDQPNRLFCNNSTAKTNWIGFSLVGQASNRTAIGARVSVKSDGVWQTQSILPVSGFGGQNTTRLLFGLNTASVIDSLVIHWPSGYRQVSTKSFAINAYHTILEELATVVHGVTFHDENQNGKWDEKEPEIGNIRLSVDPTGQTLSSHATGTFSTRMQAGKYSIGLMETKNWGLTSKATFSITQGIDSVYVPVPLTPISNGYDLSVVFSTTAWRRGFTNETIVQIRNSGTSPAVGGRLTMLYPEEAHVVRSSIEFANSGKEIQWKLADIKPGETISVSITDSISLDAFTGQKLNLFASVIASGEDLDLENNKHGEEIVVVGAIDPNDIVASPQGDGQEGFIDKDQELTYTIRFENMGTWAATYVFIDNLISDRLDLSTFKMISSSHPADYTILPSGLLKISYINIDLPTAESDPIGAHGYFKYSIKPQMDILPGEEILNTAEIVFDFESPIITNTTRHTIYRTRDQIAAPTAYPNPFNPMVQIQFDVLRRSDVTIEIYDLTGRLVETLIRGEQPAGTHSVSWDGSRFASSIYLVRMQTDVGVSTRKITLIK